MVHIILNNFGPECTEIIHLCLEGLRFMSYRILALGVVSLACFFLDFWKPENFDQIYIGFGLCGSLGWGTSSLEAP